MCTHLGGAAQGLDAAQSIGKISLLPAAEQNTCSLYRRHAISLASAGEPQLIRVERRQSSQQRPAMQQNQENPQGDEGPHANHQAQIGQQHGQASGAVADGGGDHGPSSSPTHAGASSGEESTPWLDLQESYGVASLNHPQTVPNAFAIPTASSGSMSQEEDNDAHNDVDMEDATAAHAPVLPFHLAGLPADQTASAASATFGSSPESGEFPSGNNSEASPPAYVQPTGSIETDEETDNGLAEQSGLTNPWPSDDSQQQNQTDPVMYGSVNMALGEFLQSWAQANRDETPEQTHDLRFEVPLISKKVNNEVGRKVEEVRYQDLHGDQCDLQGLNWSYMGTTRAIARARRRASYRNYVNVLGSDALDVSRSALILLTLLRF